MSRVYDEQRARIAGVTRRDRVRTITVKAAPGPGETVVSACGRIVGAMESITLPAGYAMEWGGEYENSSDAQANLAANLPSGFLGMVLTTVLLFGRVRQPVLIWLTVPMAVCGVSAGLLSTGMAFGFMSLLGALSLSGMLIKDATVLTLVAVPVLYSLFFGIRPGSAGDPAPSGIRNR